MLVIVDTSALYYPVLIELEHTAILPTLFGQVLAPTLPNPRQNFRYAGG
jgi:hypothetical protein